MANLTNVKVTDMSKGEVTGIQFEGSTYEKIAEGNVFEKSKVGDIVMSKRGRLDVAAGDYFSVVKKGNPLVATNTVIDRAESSHSLVLTDAVLFRKVAEKFEVGDYAKVIGNTPTFYVDHAFSLNQIVEVVGSGKDGSIKCAVIGTEKPYSMEDFDFVNPVDLVKATEEEIAKAEAKFETGDIVLVNDGWDRYYGEVISNKKSGEYLISDGTDEECIDENDLTMVAPKANRVD
jgi:hypothetical protein